MEYAMQLKDVTKHYEGFTLDHVNIALPGGCIMGFIGENGAGKSTTIKLALDLIRRDGGDVTLLGQDLKSARKTLKEDIGVVMDESGLPEELSTKNVNTIMRNIYRNWEEDTFRAYVGRFSLPDKKTLKEFSRGMKMKLAIAIALSHRPRLLILDEATSGLDPIVRDEMLDVFLEFIQKEDHSIFMSSHIISDLEKACDYITFIHKGKIVFNEMKDQLLETYGILKCSLQEFDGIDPSLVRGYRKNSYGVEALVDKRRLNGRYTVDRATIEDIMLYHIKENVQ